MKSLFSGFLFAFFCFLFACQNETPSTNTSTETTDKAAMTGKAVYQMYCVACHGADGKMAFSGASDLSASRLDLDTRILQITNGKGVMNAFKKIISEEEIKNVAIYVEELRVD